MSTCTVCGEGTGAGPLWLYNVPGLDTWAHSKCRGLPVDPIYIPKPNDSHVKEQETNK